MARGTATVPQALGFSMALAKGHSFMGTAPLTTDRLCLGWRHRGFTQLGFQEGCGACTEAYPSVGEGMDLETFPQLPSLKPGFIFPSA